MSWPSWVAALGPRDRSAGRALAFIPLWIALAALPVFVGYLLASILGGWIDANFTMVRGEDLTLLVRNRLQHSAIWGEDLGALAAALPGFAAKLVAISVLLVVAKRLYGRPMKTWITSATRFRRGHLLIGLIGTGVLMSIGLALWGYTSRPDYEPALLEGPPINVAIAALGLFCIVVLNAGGEEILFRGWLFQQTAAFTGRVPVLLGISAVVFALAHRELEAARLVQLLVSGLGFGWAAWRLGGLELAIGAHAGFNLAISTFMPPSSQPASQDQLAALGVPVEYATRVAIQTPFSSADWVVFVLASLVPMLVAEVVARWPISADQGIKDRSPPS